MANGSNQPVQFTRGDAERLARMEQSHKDAHDKLDVIGGFIKEHATAHTALGKTVDKNTRFRKVYTRILLWVFTTSTGIGLLAAGAKAMGWLN